MPAKASHEGVGWLTEMDDACRELVAEAMTSSGNATTLDDRGGERLRVGLVFGNQVPTVSQAMSPPEWPTGGCV
jgi:hypothetical protein